MAYGEIYFKNPDLQAESSSASSPINRGGIQCRKQQNMILNETSGK